MRNRSARLSIVAVALALALAAGCASTPPAPPKTESTREILDRDGEAISPEAPFVGEGRVVAELAPLRDDRTPATFPKRLRLAQALVRDGRAEESVALYDELLPEARRLGLAGDELIDRVEFPRAVACFRLGEQQNCVGHHTVDSCRFPLRPAAMHGLRRGSEAAIAAFESILERRPDDLLSKWLLTIACQTLGRDPETIRPEWRLDPASWRPKVPFPEFDEVAGPLGLAVTGLAGGVVLDDFDGDGQLDVMVSESYPIENDGGQLRLFRNLGDGSFEEVTKEAGLEGIRGGLNIASADFDNNGFLDVLVLRGAWQLDHGKWPNTLLRNDHGKFTDVTAKAGILRSEPTQAAAWGDYDGDGLLDLFVGVETGFPDVANGGVERFVSRLAAGWRSLTQPEVPAHLWHNRGDGTFEDVLPGMGLDVGGWIKGAVWGDSDGDGRPDLFLSRYGAPNILLRNDGPDAEGRWRFHDVAREAGVVEPHLSFPAWFFDYDNDGRDDLYVGGYPRAEVVFPGKGLPMELRTRAEDEVAGFLGNPGDSPDGKPRLFHNRGDGTFEDVTKPAGLWSAVSSMGANFGDFDNDGFLDFYLGTGTPPFYFLVPNRAFHNVGGKRFDDVTVAANLGSLAKGHGVAFADLDNDGDQDLYVVLGGAFPGDVFPNALFENPGFGNDWITLRLEGTTANRSAIGARIEVRLVDASGRLARRIFRTVGTGGSFGASCLRAEIGLGRLADDGLSIGEIEITWPDRKRSVQRLGPLAPRAFWQVKQGEPAARYELSRFCLKPD